jgi:hypothetical protein
LIFTQTAEGDGPISAMVHEASLAVIPTRLAVRDAVSDMQFPAAMTATQKAGQERLTATDRAARHEALAVGVVGDQALIPLELRP